MLHSKLIEERKNSIPSSGEKTVIRFLRKNHVKFKREFFFQELINDHTGCLLFFDFYVKSLNLVIEVDGKQHFVAINGEASFKSLVHRDNLKNRFCKKNGITMCRLVYADLVSMKKLKDCIANCLHNRKQGHKQKGLAGVRIKAKKEKKKKVRIDPRTQRKNRISDRVKKVNAIREDEIAKKREAARLNYPADVRIYLADKNNSNDEQKRTA